MAAIPNQISLELITSFENDLNKDYNEIANCLDKILSDKEQEQKLHDAKIKLDTINELLEYCRGYE